MAIMDFFDFGFHCRPVCLVAEVETEIEVSHAMSYMKTTDEVQPTYSPAGSTREGSGVISISPLSAASDYSDAWRRYSRYTAASEELSQEMPIMASEEPGMEMEYVSPGDILVVKGNENVGAVGATGGYGGHVMLAISHAVTVYRDSPQAASLLAHFPDEPSVWPIVRVHTVECVRGAVGLHFAEQIMHYEEGSDRLTMMGEIGEDGDLQEFEKEEVQVWRAPPELSATMRWNIVNEVTDSFKLHGDKTTWSMRTALRALIRSPLLEEYASEDSSDLLEDLKSYWEADPICTSVVISFWQQYIWRASTEEVLQGAEHGRGSGSYFVKTPQQLESESSNLAAERIMRFIPLKADRALPREMISALERCGWQEVQAGVHIPWKDLVSSKSVSSLPAARIRN